MAVPAAPTEQGGDKIDFVIRDNAGSEAAALRKGYFTETVGTTSVTHQGVYVISGTPKTGYKATTGSTEIAISSTSVPCDGVVVKAAAANGDTVYVGATGLTTNASTTDGYPLEPGESIGIACRNLNTVFIRRPNATNVAVYFSAQGAS